MPTQDHYKEVMEFIRQHRSDESNFDKLYSKLEGEIQMDGDENTSDEYTKNVREIREKQAEEYRQKKEKTGTAWPEFEKFVTQFEKSLTEAMKEKD